MPQQNPVVVIVGGGFGGLAGARALKKAPVTVVLIDRTNHNLFQPLLYQVATSVLALGQIGSLIRGILRNSKNTTVISARSQVSIPMPVKFSSAMRTASRFLSHTIT
jgi:NADH dehydrogenase